MREDKNIIKGNRFAELNLVTKREFYAVIDVGGKDKEGNSVTKSYVETFVGERIEAKKVLASVAKKLNGKVTYFGAVKNKR